MNKHITKIKTGLIIATGMLMPLCLFADTTTSGPLDVTSIGALLKSITTNVFGALIGLLIGAGVVVFLWGVVKYVSAGADEGSAAEGRNLMIYGIIALFVMVSVWGLVNILISTFGFQNVQTPPVPKLAQ